MYGGSSSKLNRSNPAGVGASSRLSLGGGGGNQKRFRGGPPPPPSSSRVQGGPRDGNPGGRASGGGGVGGGGGVDETFSLVSGRDAVAFASIIRLTPDLVEEIRRLEGQGGKARIKFDANANNTSGNVIEVGGREYRFTWSREFGELCDIYEERQRGVDGTGLLIESGSAWRKINVQRVLDESTKKHVKMRSEEAEKKSKSRKAIVLEPGNPSMKSQLKQLAAVEINPRRMPFLQKKEPPFKKQKVGPSSVSLNGPSKPTFKPGSSLPAKPFPKGSSRLSASPLPSPSHQSGAIVSPYKLESTSHINVAADDATRSHSVSKDSVATFQMEPSKNVSGSQERLGPFGKYGDRPMDLQNSLIKLLKENPKGMSLEALENAIGNTITASGKKIEPILKKIATYQPPGRYLLKTGVELDSFQKPSPGSGSSPEDNQNLEPASELNAVKSPPTDGRIVEKIEVPASLAESNVLPGPDLDASENIDIERNSPAIFGDKKESENSEGQAGSSSDSGSDSDSESRSSDSQSDSGSLSGSRSRSRSQAGSGSSSDSDSDASSNSNQGSDVDITTSDDEKVRKPKLHNSDTGVASPVVGRGHDSGDEHQDGHVSDIVDIENDFVDTAPSVEGKASEERGPERVSEEFHRFSPYENELIKRQHFIGSLFDEREPAFEESSKREKSSKSEKNLSKSGRGEPQHTDMKSEMTKKLKAESMAQTSTPEGSKPEHHFGSRGLSPVKFAGSVYESPLRQTLNNAERNSFADVDFQKSHNQVTSGKSNSSSQQTGRRSSDKGLRQSTHDSGGKNSRHADSISYGSKVKEKNSDLREGIRTQKENFGQDDFSDGFTSEKVLRGMREESGGDKDLMSIVAEPVQPKRVELVGKSKELGHNTVSLPGPPQKGHDGIATDKGPGGRGPILQREFSDLELGELREPVPEVTALSKQFERNQDSLKFDSGRGKPPGKAPLDPGKISTSNTSAKIQSMPASSRKRSLEQRDDNHMTLNQPLSHLESQRPARVYSSEANLPIKELTKLTKNEAGAMIGLSSEETGNNLKAPSVNGVHRFDPNRGLTSQFQKESRLQNCNNAAASVNGQKDLDSQAIQRVRESSSDNSSCSYTKFEKDKPELKGRIKDFSQYKEYVQEYKDKYESYRSLNKILENYRNQFQKIGNDLDSARGRGDMERYNKILEHLRDSYRKCRPRHKRLKKIFLVLHEELEHLKQMIREFVATHSKD
ncbi:hypothetical protein MLD38_030230 [Melastoma candidum]|uniref:Uncharacterized protein n=1 Tax=Melastoma candidum TaxID=119954 RepID=A0ACB9MN29_9MYRT|nr:hypothetical protein MLD38_030230 [Melastoma candidum]